MCQGIKWLHYHTAEGVAGARTSKGEDFIEGVVDDRQSGHGEDRRILGHKMWEEKEKTDQRKKIRNVTF